MIFIGVLCNLFKGYIKYKTLYMHFIVRLYTPRGGRTPFLGRFSIVVSEAGDHVQAINLDDIMLKLKGITRSIEIGGYEALKMLIPPSQKVIFSFFPLIAIFCQNFATIVIFGVLCNLFKGYIIIKTLYMHFIVRLYTPRGGYPHF